MKSRIGIIAVVGFALLLWGTAALAEDIRGTEPIRAKNTRTRTVQLGDRTLKVDANSTILDAAGNRIQLSDLDVPDLGHGGTDPMLGSLLGRYIVTRHGSRFTLVRLEVLALQE